MLKNKWIILGLVVVVVSFTSCGIFKGCGCPKVSKVKGRFENLKMC
jgi:hypothetical protein